MYTLIKINFPFSYLKNGKIPVPKRHCRAYLYIPTHSAVIIIINPRPLTRPTGDHHCRVAVVGERGRYKSVLFIRVRRSRHDLYDLYLYILVTRTTDPLRSRAGFMKYAKGVKIL